MTTEPQAQTSDRERQQWVDHLDEGRLSKWSDMRTVADMLRADAEKIRALEAALSAVVRWAEQRCPCENDEPKQCPLCDAKVDDFSIGGVCKAVPRTFPPSLLTAMHRALPLSLSLAATQSPRSEAGEGK